MNRVRQAMNKAINVHGSVMQSNLPTNMVSPLPELHQDLFALPFRPTDRIVAAWTPLDVTFEPNFELVPGSHWQVAQSLQINNIK